MFNILVDTCVWLGGRKGEERRRQESFRLAPRNVVVNVVDETTPDPILGPISLPEHPGKAGPLYTLLVVLVSWLASPLPPRIANGL
jgi:hypothetical protein